MANLSSYLPGGIDPAAVTITGGTINGTTIGASTAAAGTFTTITGSGDLAVDTDTLFVDVSEDKVGINTTSPLSPLSVHGDGTTIRLDGTGNTTRSIFFRSTTSSNPAQIFSDGSLRLYTEDAGTDIRFHTNSNGSTNERMRIDASGNVGIGNTIFTSPRVNAPHLVVGNGSNAPGLTLYSTSNSQGSINFADATSGTDAYDGGLVYNFGSGSPNMTFHVNAAAERMRIDSSGTVLIGKSALDNTSAGYRFEPGSTGYASFVNTGTASSHRVLYLNRQSADGTSVEFSRANSTVGTISVTSSATSYNTSSDERLKENIVDAPAGNIDAIRVRSFDWKVDGSHQTYGMVAQELVDVAPEAVSQGETDDGMWAVDYSKLVPMMIKEIQDLKAEVAALKGA